MDTTVILPKRHAVVIGRTWLAILALIALDAVWMHRIGIRLSRQTLVTVPCAAALLLAVSLIYKHVRRDDGIWLAASVANQLVVGTLAVAVLNYLGTWLAYPLWDEHYIAADKWLGVDWPAYIGWMDRHPLLTHVLDFSYQTTDPEVMVFLMLLCFFKRNVELHRFVLQFLMGAFIAIVIGIFWPSLGPYVYANTDPASYPNLAIATCCDYKFDDLAMRGHSMNVLPAAFQGLVNFPSFHSTIAVIIIYAARALPWRPVRFFIVALNILMLLSTPVSGGHYPVDTLGGILLGFAVIAWSVRLLPQEREADAR